MKVWYDSGWSRGMPTYSSMLKVTTSWMSALVQTRPPHGDHKKGAPSTGGSTTRDCNSTHLERDLASLVVLNETAVDRERGRAGRETEDKVGVVGSGAELVDALDNVVSNVVSDLGLGVADSETHGGGCESCRGLVLGCGVAEEAIWFYLEVEKS